MDEANTDRHHARTRDVTSLIVRSTSGARLVIRDRDSNSIVLCRNRLERDGAMRRAAEAVRRRCGRSRSSVSGVATGTEGRRRRARGGRTSRSSPGGKEVGQPGDFDETQRS